MINAVTQMRLGSQWVVRLQEAGIPCGPINSIDQVFSDAQVMHREMVVEVPHPTAGKVRLVGFPYKLSRTPAGITRHPPLLGEHTEIVLRDVLGYSAETIASLHEEQTI
jgi:formyl-CoA transferase